MRAATIKILTLLASDKKRDASCKVVDLADSLVRNTKIHNSPAYSRKKNKEVPDIVTCPKFHVGHMWQGSKQGRWQVNCSKKIQAFACIKGGQLALLSKPQDQTMSTSRPPSVASRCPVRPSYLQCGSRQFTSQAGGRTEQCGSQAGGALCLDCLCCSEYG